MATRRPATAARAGALARWQARRQEEAQYPALYLHVWANADGVHCDARVDSMTVGGKLRRVQIARATWRPSEVSERRIVDWGQRALSRWLADNPEEMYNAS